MLKFLLKTFQAVMNHRTDWCASSYLESHSKNILRVRRPAENRHADDVLSEIYGAISVLDGLGGQR